MQQLDLFETSPEYYLHSEIQKLKNSTDKRCRAIFALLTELQDQVIKLKEINEKAV